MPVDYFAFLHWIGLERRQSADRAKPRITAGHFPYKNDRRQEALCVICLRMFSPNEEWLEHPERSRYGHVPMRMFSADLPPMAIPAHGSGIQFQGQTFRSSCGSGVLTFCCRCSAANSAGGIRWQLLSGIENSGSRLNLRFWPLVRIPPAAACGSLPSEPAAQPDSVDDSR